MSSTVILYGFCVKAELVKKGLVNVYRIEKEFSEYWGIPDVAFTLAY